MAREHILYDLNFLKFVGVCFMDNIWTVGICPMGTTEVYMFCGCWGAVLGATIRYRCLMVLLSFFTASFMSSCSIDC